MLLGLVAGCAAILREVLLTRGTYPSAALIKALLINGADILSGQYADTEMNTCPNPGSGFGRVNLLNSSKIAVVGDLDSGFVDGTPLHQSQMFTTNITIPKDGNRYPTLTVKWDEPGWNFTVADCDRELRAGNPRIEVLTASNPSLVPAVEEHHDNKTPPDNQLQIVSLTLQPGEDLIIGRRLREILGSARKKAKA